MHLPFQSGSSSMEHAIELDELPSGTWADRTMRAITITVTDTNADSTTEQPVSPPGSPRLSLSLPIVPWSNAREKNALYHVHCSELEAELSTIPSFDARRSALGWYRRFIWPFGEEEWEWLYFIFISRNPSEIPHRKTYARKRRRAEACIYDSGTEVKEGRNFRMKPQPGVDPTCFSVAVRQGQLFGGWQWPVEHATEVDDVEEDGPGEVDARVMFTVTPPKGESWESLRLAQHEAGLKATLDWREEVRCLRPNYTNPFPTILESFTSFTECVRPRTVIAQVLDRTDITVKFFKGFQWEWNPLEMVKYNWPRAYEGARVRVRKWTPFVRPAETKEAEDMRGYLSFV